MIESGYEPNYIVGDMDSLSKDLMLKYRSIIFRDSCQETNDLTKAVKFTGSLLERGEYRVSILGATGKREDHTLGNISLLPSFEEILPNMEIRMVTDHGEFRVIRDSCSLNVGKNRSISIFSFDNTLKIESAGLEYPTDNVIFDLWWKATLNKSISDKITLKFSHPAKALIFLTR